MLVQMSSQFTWRLPTCVRTSSFLQNLWLLKSHFLLTKWSNLTAKFYHFIKCLESNVIILIWMPSSVFIFTFLRDITAMLPIFYLHVLRKNLEWNYCGHTGMECYKITMCVCLDLYYEKSEAAVFYFFHLWKKQTNKQKQENIWNHNSVLRVFRLHWPSVILSVWKKEEKSASTFSTFMFFEADCCFLSVKQHSIPDQILFQYTPTTRSLIRVIGMCTLTHL